MKGTHLLVISVDALVYEDIADHAQLPNIAKFFKEGSVVQAVRTVYPSLTHTIHASMMSGNPPARTAIISNTQFPSGQWYNKLHELACPSLFHLAKQKGLSCAACRWPVTAQGFDTIDYLIAEVTKEEAARYSTQELLHRVSSPILWNTVIKAHQQVLEGKKQPQEDIFSTRCAADIIRLYKPHLLLTHPSLVDSARHHHGLFHPEVAKAVTIADELIGMLLQSIEDAALTELTNIVVASDHGHLGVTRDVALNTLLARRGLLVHDEQGTITGWKARAHSCGLSAHIYLSDPCDASLHQEVASMLYALSADPESGISQVFTREEASRTHGLDGSFSFVVETDGNTQFSDSCLEPASRNLFVDDHHGSSSHGHLPHKGPQPVLLAMGPDIKAGTILSSCSILDEAPTFAHLLGLRFEDVQGRILTEILAQEEAAIKG